MKDIKPSKPEVRSRNEDTAIDSWDTAGPPPRRDESEFTEHERALLDAWDKTNAPSPADDAQFAARLLEVLDARLEAPIGVHPSGSHRMAEMRDELACAQMAADAQSDGTAPTAGLPGLTVIDLAAQRAGRGDTRPGGRALPQPIECTFRWWQPDACDGPDRIVPRVLCDRLGEGGPGGATDRARSWLEAFGVGGDRLRDPVPVRRRRYELLMDNRWPAAPPVTHVVACGTSIAPADHGEPVSPKKLVVLMVAANPRRSSALRLSLECAAIQQELEKVPQCDGFHFESRWAVNLRELIGHLAELSPTVLHVAGHGAGGSGLVLQDALGDARPVPARALTRMLETTSRSVRIAVLNACFRKRQADGLRRRVDCVVGINGGIDDDAARMFACEFYAALGNHRSVGNAFEHSVATLAARQLPHEVQPHCLPRKGVDVRTLGLWDPGPAVAVPQPGT